MIWEREIVALAGQAQSLALQAEECDVVAAHFRPRFEAMYALLEKAGRLHEREALYRMMQYVHSRENDAKRFRQEEQELRDAIAALTVKVTR